MFFTIGSLFSQGEYLIDINYNLELLKKSQTEPIKKDSRSVEKVYFLIDTLNLPFMDDFSTDRFTYNHLPNFTEAEIKDSVGVNFRVNGSILDSIRYMTDTSWNYTYNSATNTVDSTPNSSFQVAIYEEGPFPNNPFVPAKAFTAWPDYYRIFIDSMGQPDTAYITPSKILYLDTIVTIVAFVSGKNTLWLDENVFINNSFATGPPTIGVVTFDGIKNNGLAYAPNQPTSYGVADYLTSKPLFLNSPASDSIYFSFYYQPQGNGNDPESPDSLVLEFFSPLDTAWKWRWSTRGGPVHPFKQVMIPITQQEFLQDGFRFRFKNYASLSGNLDHWNVDYIRIGKNRTINDIYPEDLAFKDPANILLSNYREMPWKQYKANPSGEMNNSLTVNLRNNSDIGKVHDYSYTIKDLNNTVIETKVSAGSASPTSDFSYTNPLDIPYFPVSAGDYAKFEITNRVNTSIDVNRNNDTIRYIQKFNNYYAYDDGVPEAGYGVNKIGAKLAYKFILNTTDTLTAVAMHFTPINYDQQYYPFRLTVWSNLDAETILYQEENYSYPVHTPGKNGFHEYALTSPLVVSGIIYVGWVQVNDMELNIGFDKNTDQKDKVFYNVDGNWINSQYPGALMIRPVFGLSKDPEVGIAEQPINITKEDFIKIYPNPAKDKLFIEGIADYNNTSITLYDIYGSKIFHHQQTEAIDISGFADGIYIIRINNHLSGTTFTRKLIIKK